MKEWGSSTPPPTDPRERAFAQSQMAKVVTGNEFLLLVEKAGVLVFGDKVRRVVIDADVSEPLVMYVERYGDERILQVATSLEGTRIETVEVGKEQAGDATR